MEQEINTTQTTKPEEETRQLIEGAFLYGKGQQGFGERAPREKQHTFGKVQTTKKRERENGRKVIKLRPVY